MSYYRSYFEKNNTLIKGSKVNTAKSPTTEIFYGSGFSKFIFKVDFTDLQNKIINGDYIIDDNTKHYLKLTNTIFGDESFLGTTRMTGRKRASAFRMIIFAIPEEWSEGIGFDYESSNDEINIDNSSYSLTPSNWYARNNDFSWSIPGVYDSSPSVISEISFDNGNENINVDITNYVNSIVLSGATNYGLGVAFPPEYENITVNVEQSVSFFTKYTQTFYEPYVETVINDRIVDNRSNFISGIEQNLYLYVTKGTNFYDLDELPVVDINNNSGTTISGLSNLLTTKVRKGVYKVTFNLDDPLINGKQFFYDMWKNLSIDGADIPYVTQKFVPKQYYSVYSIGENPTDTTRYAIQFYGIKQNEKVVRGETRKIVVKFRSIDRTKPEVFNDVFYRIFIKEGPTNVIVHDWTQLDVTNENSFILDTGIYIPREYYIEIKAKTHGEEIFYNEYIKFQILSEKI